MSVTPLPRDPEDEQSERSPRRSPPPAPGRAPSLIDSFNYAFEGIIHVLRTQRNLRIHFLAAVLVFGAAIAVGVSRLQLIALVLAIAFVLVAEMLNTAIEGIIDVSSHDRFDPNARSSRRTSPPAPCRSFHHWPSRSRLPRLPERGRRACDRRSTYRVRQRRAGRHHARRPRPRLVLIVIATRRGPGTRDAPLRGCGLPSRPRRGRLRRLGPAITYLVGDSHPLRGLGAR
jgi:diacylglycerol kinase